jgi:hypothetical protein
MDSTIGQPGHGLCPRQNFPYGQRPGARPGCRK